MVALALSNGAMKGVLPILGGVLMGLALLISFYLDLANTAQGGAIDLRNRITGLRLLEHGIDPYHYKWSRSEPEEYCDPFNNPKLEVSRTTATPALVLVNLPLAPLPYRLAQFLWLFAEWALLLGTGWLWLRAGTTPRQRWLVALFVAGFSFTAAWRLHAERGQSYVLLAFLPAAWMTLTLHPKRSNSFVAGLIAGFLIAFRPPFALLIPFLALHRRGQWWGAATGLVIGVVVPMLWVPGCWADYFSAMQVNSLLNRTHYFPHFSQAYPPRIEGVPTDILAHYSEIPFAEFSFPALLSWLGLGPWPDAALVATVTALFGVWLGSSRAEPNERLLTGLAASLFLADLFLPAYRNNYNDLLILNVVLAACVTTAKIPWLAWPCLAALPIGWAVYVWEPTDAWQINLPTTFFTVGAVIAVMPATFLFNKRARSRKVANAC
jgi:hypothetical protein